MIYYIKTIISVGFYFKVTILKSFALTYFYTNLVTLWSRKFSICDKNGSSIVILSCSVQCLTISECLGLFIVTFSLIIEICQYSPAILFWS